MMQEHTKNHSRRDSLRRREDARTVLLRMALDEERAKRIRALKEERPDLTWAQIADAVGVRERSAFNWQRTGGISHENAKKLATFLGVDVDWLWSGREQAESPALMDRLSQRQGDRAILEALASIDERLTKIENELRRRAIEAPTPELPGELGRYEPAAADTPANQKRRKTG